MRIKIRLRYSEDRVTDVYIHSACTLDIHHACSNIVLYGACSVYYRTVIYIIIYIYIYIHIHNILYIYIQHAQTSTCIEPIRIDLWVIIQ